MPANVRLSAIGDAEARLEVPQVSVVMGRGMKWPGMVVRCSVAGREVRTLASSAVRRTVPERLRYSPGSIPRTEALRCPRPISALTTLTDCTHIPDQPTVKSAAARVVAHSLPEPSLCDPALVLRAVLYVQGVMALGALAAAPSVGEVWLEVAGAAAQSLPVLLVWLLTVCLTQRAGGRLASLSTVLLLQGWAALCAAAMSMFWQSGVGGAVSGWRLLVAGLLGAVLSGVFMQWLRQRLKRALPVAQASRLIELQARIRPHFLFNTLNTALALIRIEPGKAERVLENLAELFRAGLGPGDDLRPTSLQQELDLARLYVEIEQLRFGGRLRIAWDLDPRAGGVSVPRLMLQPLLENAVRHGVEPSSSGGDILVVTLVQHGVVRLMVNNSLPQEASVPGQGMALNNVRDRLTLMHDLAADLRTVRTEDSFRVEITLPAA